MSSNSSSNAVLPTPATWTREKLLAANLRVAIRMTNRSHEYTDNIVGHAVGKRLIKKLTILALDRTTDEICGSLSLKIDWQKHEASLHIHGDALKTLPTSFEHSGESIQVTEIAGVLAEYAQYFELKLHWQVTYADGVNHEEADRLLGTSTSKSRQWKNGKARSAIAQVADLPELSVALRLLEDPTDSDPGFVLDFDAISIDSDPGFTLNLEAILQAPNP